MKRLFLVAILVVITLNANSQDHVAVNDISGSGKPCGWDPSITFTLIDPENCEIYPVTITIYSPGYPNYLSATYSSSGLGYPGYQFIQVVVDTYIGPLTVGDYITPLTCLLTPRQSWETIGKESCQYGAQWIYTSTSPLGTAYVYLN